MSASKHRPKNLAFAIASDLHAHDQQGDASPSHLSARTDETNGMRHPITGLCELIARERLRVDALLCPGDLGDKANVVGIRYAWEKLAQLKAKLKAKEIFATVGNHDVDSRGQHNDFDPRGFLQTLRPRFPIHQEASFNHYWAQHFVVVERKDFRLLLLNSSAFHGYEQEHEHGRISMHTINAVRETLAATQSKPVNILLCHHHPLQHSEQDLGEHDVMKGGQELLDLLGSGDYGDWVVIHGHKHHPKLTYAAGPSSVTPIVFAAGSLCTNIYKTIQGSARNQFYVIEFPVAEIKACGLVGTFRSWNWNFGKGWQVASPGSGLPSSGGFGHRERPLILANRICTAFQESTIAWSEILRRIPELRYVHPRDLDLITGELKSRFQLTVLEADGFPVRLERQL